MLKTIINFVFPLTVSGVMGQFTKVVSDLNKVAARQRSIATTKDLLAEDFYTLAFEAEEDAEEALIEAANAEQLAAKIAYQFGLDQ